MTEFKGLVRLYIYALPICIAIGLFTWLGLYLGLSVLENTQTDGPGSSEALWLTFKIVVLFIVLAPFIPSLIYLKNSEKEKSDPNRFNRKHIRAYNLGSIGRDHVLNTLEKLDFFDVEVKESEDCIKVYAKHKGVLIPSSSKIFSDDWYRSRKVAISLGPDSMSIEVEPINKFEIMDFSLSNYYYLNLLEKEFGLHGL